MKVSRQTSWTVRREITDTLNRILIFKTRHNKYEQNGAIHNNNNNNNNNKKTPEAGKMNYTVGLACMMFRGQTAQQALIRHTNYKYQALSTQPIKFVPLNKKVRFVNVYCRK